MDIVYIILWLGFTLVVAGLGNERQIGPGKAFIISLLLSPIVGLVVVVSSKRKDTIAYEEKMLDLQQQVLEQREGEEYTDSYEGSMLGVADELIKYKSLLDAGALTQAEFDAQKAKLLSR